MQISVKTAMGGTIMLNVDGEDTIDIVMDRIADETGIRRVEQRMHVECGQVTIFVKSSCGKTLGVKARRSDLVGSLVEKLQARIPFTPERHRLQLRGFDLDPLATLSEYHVEAGTELVEASDDVFEEPCMEFSPHAKRHRASGSES